jgi:hypothetical protein
MPPEPLDKKMGTPPRLMNLESLAPKKLSDEPLELPSIEKSDI